MRSESGRIHSIESFGTVDGPGIRMVIFFQGCPLRCLYCHNPDTWEAGKGRLMSVDGILAEYSRNRGFYRHGGITATGGEPLLQLGFLTSLFHKAKENGIHTALDTSGWPYREEMEDDYSDLAAAADLVLLDIKHSDPEGHKKLTGRDLDPVMAFLSFLDRKGIDTVIRHVSVPDITDSQKELEGIGKIMAKHRCIKGLDVLPYHTMGKKKYQELGLEYPLAGVPAMAKEEAQRNRRIIMEACSRARSGA